MAKHDVEITRDDADVIVTFIDVITDGIWATLRSKVLNSERAPLPMEIVLALAKLADLAGVDPPLGPEDFADEKARGAGRPQKIRNSP
jgi:hypothetical protein